MSASKVPLVKAKDTPQKNMPSEYLRKVGQKSQDNNDNDLNSLPQSKTLFREI